eukprot:CAMPEP_0119153854 /NCGR_PEP_ID=MMETSP1310-20130426/49927_1 /TAXON_ID=464262 /ORGANISM="Genus nov. species nov., Strain RCC2339" /LENGTH=52 /DNA_ID=CAMNT_0007146335 /DNA_START=316 /DNA_END=474 /DNA_ORIENTATION=-
MTVATATTGIRGEGVTIMGLYRKAKVPAGAGARREEVGGKIKDGSGKQDSRE